MSDDPVRDVPSVDDDVRRVVLWLPDGHALRRTAGFHGQTNGEKAMSKQNQGAMRKQDGMKMPMPMKGGKKGC
jgi:hypothetical protein